MPGLMVFFLFFFVPFKGQLPKLSCKRHWGSVLSLGLIERHSLRSTLLQNVMLRKKAPYNVYQCISVFNKWHFESIGSFSLVWNSHWNPCYNFFFFFYIKSIFCKMWTCSTCAIKSHIDTPNDMHILHVLHTNAWSWCYLELIIHSSYGSEYIMSSWYKPLKIN